VVDQSRFDESGHWISPPEAWIEQIDDQLMTAKMAGRIRSAIEDLPAR